MTCTVRSFLGQVAVVTGAAANIGEAHAAKFAKLGADAACGAVQSADATRAIVEGVDKNTMTLKQFLSAVVLSASLVLCGTASRAETGSSQDKDAGAELAMGTLRSAKVNGTSITYLRAGSGPITIVLIHGWPQSAYEWHKACRNLLAHIP